MALCTPVGVPTAFSFRLTAAAWHSPLYVDGERFPSSRSFTRSAKQADFWPTGFAPEAHVRNLPSDTLCIGTEHSGKLLEHFPNSAPLPQPHRSKP